jgi:hypothetical protein
MADRRNSKPQPDSGAPGHVVVDSRGRNVWQWNGANTDSTTSMLRSLDNPDLALEPTRQLRRPKAADPESGSPRGRGAAAGGAPDRSDRRQSAGQAGRSGEPMSRLAGQRAQPAGRPDGKADRSTLRTEGSGRNKIGGGFDPYNRS